MDDDYMMGKIMNEETTMISAWRKFINKSDISNEAAGNFNQPSNGHHNANGGSIPPGIQKLDKELQRKFARGVNYNMKVVIKGDSRVGKSSLFKLLKGQPFEESYRETETLNVTSINWNYKATDDIVKIDLWEAIDSNKRLTINHVDLKSDSNAPAAQQPAQTNFSNLAHMNGGQSNGNCQTIESKNNNTKRSSLPTSNSNFDNLPESAKQSLAMLSEQIDVYRGTDAVLLVMDMTKSWTFKYVQNELPKVPRHIPILLIANHRDQGHHRTITPEQVKAYVDGLNRNPGDGIIMYTEASMKNSFGLKLIEKFFNIPFLKLQESSLLKQLELNRCEFMTTIEELQLMQESTNKEYEQYLELQTIKRRQQADAMSPVNSGLLQLDELTREQIRNTTMSSETIEQMNNSTARSIESKNDSSSQPSSAQQLAQQNFVNNRLTSIVIGAKCPLPETKKIQMTQQAPADEQNSVTPVGNSPVDEQDASIDDSDEDEIPRANPLVANYQSDLDSDDQVQAESPSPGGNINDKDKDKS